MVTATMSESKDKKEVPAVGPITGGKVYLITIGDHEDCIAEEYIGIGPLVVSTIRGDIKALSGDAIVTLWDEENKRDLVFVIPSEIFYLIKPDFDSEEDGMTSDDYQKYQEEPLPTTQPASTTSPTALSKTGSSSTSVASTRTSTPTTSR